MQRGWVLPQLPATLSGPVEERLERCLAAQDAATRARLAASGELQAGLIAVLGGSRTVADTLVREPGWLRELIVDGRLSASLDEAGCRAEFARQAELGEEAQFMAALRRLRRRHWMRIAWRDLAGLAPIDVILKEQSLIAECCVASALAYAHGALSERHGWARGPDGGRIELLVLGMGKLGGYELNFSSDIDLVFLFAAAGESDGARSLANEAYFTRLGQRIIRLLHEPTDDGFVFRVDMRLRPFGDSGPLVMGFAAFERYLQQQGRDWERYAYIKARPLTARDAGQRLYAEVLRPFVYRRYLDYGVFESLREMKAMISREVERRELAHNIKLGAGGIREIEFIAQVFQLVRGGNVPELRTTSLTGVLETLARRDMLEASRVAVLLDAYRFMRRIENRLQAYDEAQVHDLPADAAGRARLAYTMGFPDWSAFAEVLAGHRERVADCFAELVAVPSQRAAPSPAAGWAEGMDEPRAVAALAELGIVAPQAVVAELETLRRGGLYRRLDTLGRKRLEELLPCVLEGLKGSPAPQVIFARVATILSAVGRRSAYFSLLIENPQALERLLALCAETDFLAERIAEHPLLLDELLDQRIFEAPPDRAELARELTDRMTQAAADDLEAQLEKLVEFQRAAVFRVAVTDLSGKLPLMRVSDRLTDIAELILEQILTLAWQRMREQYGRPFCVEQGQRRAAGFAIAAYGKLGGLELGYGSDLDIVFLHDSSGSEQTTDGARALDNGRFFARLGQRIVTMLSTQTRSGSLYEVDMRLRPSGNAGLLVTSLVAFEQYQRKEAWTWEHQALLRARAVAGAPRVRNRFEVLRRSILRESVRRETLADEVSDMRARMRAELSRSGPGGFDLKQDAGGIADIEFLVQYLVLAHCAERAELLTFSDNVRQLEGLAAAGLLAHADAEQLTAVYLAYRQRLHRLALQGRDAVVRETEYAGERAFVIRCWEVAFAGSSGT